MRPGKVYLELDRDVAEALAGTAQFYGPDGKKRRRAFERGKEALHNALEHPDLTQQPVLLSDEDRELMAYLAEYSGGRAPISTQAADRLRKLAQQHYGVEGADRG